MTPRRLFAGRAFLWFGASVSLLFIAVSLWALCWITREPKHCIRWRFTSNDGKSFHDDVWFDRDGIRPEPWNVKISKLSGDLVLSVPTEKDLPWYKLPFQSFRLEKRVPYKNGLINGSVIDFDENGNESSISQHRDGVEHGVQCFFHSEGIFSHLSSYKNGVMHGASISCWTNGLLSGAYVYSKGEPSGLSRGWNQSGELKSEGIITNQNKRIGKHSFWLHSNGAKSHEIHYSTNGVPAETTIWAADGQRIGTGIYKDGQEWNGYFVLQHKGFTGLGQFDEGKLIEVDSKWLTEKTQE